MENGHERQKEQSRRMIENALFSLMEKKDYGQITVSEIVRTADVARRTFYRFYDGKDAVMHGYFEKLCQSYRENASELPCYDIRRVAEDFFSFWYLHRDILLLLHRSGMEDMLYGEIRRAAFCVVKGRIGSRAEKEGEAAEYFAEYSVGGFCNLLRRWVEEGMAEKPEEYAKKVSDALGIFGFPS